MATKKTTTKKAVKKITNPKMDELTFYVLQTQKYGLEVGNTYDFSPVFGEKVHAFKIALPKLPKTPKEDQNVITLVPKVPGEFPSS